MPRLGLKENWKQFTLLVILNAFVGGMIGLERTIFPKFAEDEFSIVSDFSVFSFIIVFGFSKAITNYFSGTLANRIGRKNLLIAGWLIAFPVPLIMLHAGSWNWIVFSNVLLGIHQGLTWSGTVVMKIDLVGEKNRGLAMGLNEFSGYLAVAVVAYVTAFLADRYGVRPYPFYLGILIAAIGLLISVFFIRDTAKHVKLEEVESKIVLKKNIFFSTTFFDKNLSAVTQAGLVNNLNDAMVWAALPLLLLKQGLSLHEVGVIAAIYPASWGIGQLFTGKLSDLKGRKQLLFWGMFLQSLAILMMYFAQSFWMFSLLSLILGMGTALVYPTFLAAVADQTHPSQRAQALGVFRFWRDSGYAFGAIISGVVAESFDLEYSVLVVGALTFLSAWIIFFRMKE